MATHESTPSHENASTIARGATISFVGSAGGYLFGFLYVVAIARIFGPEQLGAYLVGFNVARMLTAVCTLGLEMAIVRYVAMHLGVGDHGRSRGVVRASLLLAGPSLLLGALVLGVASTPLAETVLHRADMNVLFVGFAIGMPFRGAASLLASVPLAMRRPLAGTLCNELGYWALCLALTGLFVLSGFGFHSVIVAHVGSAVAMTGLAHVFCRRTFWRTVTGTAVKPSTRSLLAFSLPALLIYLSSLLLKTADIVLLGYFVGAKVSGIYGAAAQLAAVGMVFLASFAMVTGPILADLHHRGESGELARVLKLTSRWALMLGLPYFMFLCVLSAPILRIYQPGFEAGASSLILLSVAQVFNVATGVVGYLLIMSGRQVAELINSVLMGGLNVLLNVLLIPRYGMNGAAVATGLSIIAVNVIRVAQVRRFHGMHPFGVGMLRPLAAGVLAAAVILLLVHGLTGPPTGLLGVAIAGVCVLGIYGLASLATGALDDVRNLLLALRSRVAPVESSCNPTESSS